MIDPTTVLGPWLLRGGLQQYRWGDETFLPRLLRLPDPRGPYAELWLGSHPSLPSQLRTDDDTPLDRFIERTPEILGSNAGRPQGSAAPRLPYLLKLLSAAQPLSVQVHPDKAQAQVGFLKEELSGTPRNAAERSYRDDNHKPELLVALTSTYVLAGFRPLVEIAETLRELPELTSVLPVYQATPAGLRELLRAYFALPASVLAPALETLLERLGAGCTTAGPEPLDPAYWAVTADRILRGEGVASDGQPIPTPDRGLLFVFLLNLRCLSPGEGLFVPAGLPHAYLRGSGVELMASSDNVLRCGLTGKFMDPQELLRVVQFRGVSPPLLSPAPTLFADELAYRTPAQEFELRCIRVTKGQSLRRQANGPELLLALPPDPESLAEDRPLLEVAGPSGDVLLSAGDCCLLGASAEYALTGRAPAVVYRVTRPGADGSATFRSRSPMPLSFGTSGLRGLVTDITDLEAYINTRGFLDFALANGDVPQGGTVALGGDLRPSTHSDDRSILLAVVRGIEDTGLHVDYAGRLPTPALALYALAQGVPSIMVTGSHIPFDRNGIKFNKSSGEVLKADEEPILTCIARVRALAYGCRPDSSPFADDGMFRQGQMPVLPRENPAARDLYRRRYLDFFPIGALAGLRVVVYEHSAVGRELLVRILRSLGAEVHAAGRASGFVAIDTEALSADTLPMLQRLADGVAVEHGAVDAVVSTDGDSDRPLLLGVDREGKVEFVSGDRLGIVVTQYLGADAVAVPVSATDAVERHLSARGVSVVRTRIGSPHVIAAMEGLQGKTIVGFEANGGFLVGTSVTLEDGTLAPLATRDALLPLCAVLHEAARTRLGVVGLMRQLPARYTAAGLLDAVPVQECRALLSHLGPPSPEVIAASLADGQIEVTPAGAEARAPTPDEASALKRTMERLGRVFTPQDGFSQVRNVDFTDGLRMTFASGDIAHIRPSGNAPQLRIYAVADSEARAQEIVRLSLTEPDGLLRRALHAAQEARFVAAVRVNIALTDALFETGAPAAVIGTVSGSLAAQAFWQERLDRMREDFGARLALSFHEDLPVNQAFGLLLLWQRLAEHLAPGEGALCAFVFGEGTRATPYTETDNGQKPALLTPVMHGQGDSRRPLSMVELALRYFAPVESYLRRSGFDGIVVKWGDEVQIPTRDLSGSDPRFANADVVRFVSVRPMTETDAANKEWMGVDDTGRITGFIPRRPLAEMQPLADRGLLFQRHGRLWGGVNLGSIAVSRRLLDALLAEFQKEVNDPAADRSTRPDLDPQLFTALTIACMDDPEARAQALDQARQESQAVSQMLSFMPDMAERLRGVVERLSARDGRPVRIMALDFEDQYWGDVGQHRQMFDFLTSLNGHGPSGAIARTVARIPDARDPEGNIIAGRCRLAAGVTVRNSVLIDVVVEQEGHIEDSVLVGTHARVVKACGAFDLFSTADALHLAPRAGSYQVISTEPVNVDEGERLTTLFTPNGPVLMRVHEDTNLRDRPRTYDRPIAGNPLSFQEAHTIMVEASPQRVAAMREQYRRRVAELITGPS